MYIPQTNKMTDIHEIVNFMQRFSFATIVSVQNEMPVATHLPFVVVEKDNEIKLYSHFAKANAQQNNIESGKVLIIFSEPHAYISPTNYDQFLSVPTWNYIAVHVYGEIKIVSEQKEVVSILERTINTYESSYTTQWNQLPRDFKDKMMHGIVAFEVCVSDIQAKKKLSQNKTKKEQEKIINTLSKSADSNEKLIAEYMSREFEGI
jgi:transcriptional regulator